MALHDADDLARASAEAMWAEDRSSAGLGMSIDEIRPGHAVLSMEITSSMVNGLGICHGGFIFTLADSAMAYASNSHGERAVAQNCTITYLRPARQGERLRAEAIERHRAGRSAMTDVRVIGEAGDAVAEFRGHTRTVGGSFFPAEK